ncbi:MAG: hypothetical protein PVJ39_17095 [Gammaproteobacteria bacterium]|jgi:hypothetical protein
MRHNKTRCYYGFALLGLCLPFTAEADEHVSQLGQLIDNQFRSYAENLSASQSHRALARRPTNSPAILDVGFDIDPTPIDHQSLLEPLASNQSSRVLYIPRFHIRTSYLDGWNAGAFYSSVPDSDIQIYGGELRYSLNAHNRSVLPSLSVRGTYSQLTGVSDLFVTSTGVEVSVSKGFSNFTPYAGVGTTWLDGEYQLDGYTSHLTENRYFLGLRFDLGLFNLSAQTEQTGETSTTKATMDVRF